MNKKELWLRIRNYHFNHIVPVNLWGKINERFGGVDASTKAFADKISKKHGWSKAFALKAVREYKKFVYLGVISEFHVTPSKFIDVVWHEHILFTNAYNTFCTEIIEYRFEHYPELITEAEQTAFYKTQFLKTIERYINEFGKFPPKEIWTITKFYQDKITDDYSELKRNGYPERSVGNDISLYESFSNAEISENSMTEFGGGDGGGAGASGGWDDGSGADASDGGDGGGDGGSGCSSGCGGGD